MADTTTVFQSGNSQAVRLPKAFRFKSKTVEIFRRGNEVVLREKPRTMQEVVDEAFADLPPMTEQDHAEMEAMLSVITQPQAQQERDGDARLGKAKDPARAAPAAKRPAKRTSG
jgi:antitoxin VapB